MRLERGGKRETVESYLPEVFEIVVGTGRRIAAVRGLRAEDIRLDRRPSEPYGAIVFRADTDKMGKEWRCPVTERVRHALESALRKRQAVGPGPLFPKPSAPTKHVGYAEVTAWLRKAEGLAELQRQERGAWHPYRRRWGSVRKGLEDADVMRAGGWSSLAAFKVYQQPDPETTLRVVLHEAELREAK
jgi:integrase